MKKNLGLDLGTNSIGWALTELDFTKKEGEINALGSRIIPMSQDILGKFDSGVTISQTAERTGYRGVRRLLQRNLLRRERLHRVLNIMDFLPEHYTKEIDFKKHLGQFKNEVEVKLNYRENEQGKHKFIFMNSFDEMAKEFETNGLSTKIPLDWTLYYLRKKALSQKISKEELAWIILNFNQKRGYYQLRGEEEENQDKNEEFYTLKVVDVKETEDKKKDGSIWYNVILENGWVYKRSSKIPLFDWLSKTKEFIVTTTLDEDGTEKKDKDGEVKRSFRAVNSEDDWIAIKKKTEQDIDKSHKKVGQYIYETLLQNPSQKIRGKLVKTIERKFYKEELISILTEQKKHHPELSDKLLYKACVEELYPRNEAHQQNIINNDFTYLLVEDVIFYQRPLKSKKSTISNCPYESRSFIKEGIKEVQPIKCISRSNPIFQEFRLWQFIKNLKIHQRGITINNIPEIDYPVTEQFLKTQVEIIELYDFLNDKREIDQKQLLKHFKVSEKTHRWNYVEDKKYPCNDTRASFLNRLSKVTNLNPDTFLTKETEHELWHIVYSVKDKKEFEIALKSFAVKKNIDESSFVENFKKFPPFKNEYGAYSEKAIKKLLTLMRLGKYWNEEGIESTAKNRIQSIIERLRTINFDKEKIDAITDDDIPKQVLKSFIVSRENPFSGLNTYQACYAIYNRHSEVSEITKWKTPNDIAKFLAEFKQHSLRNPIVEQVVTETLRVVKDIWELYGEGRQDFFNEIHIELGREMKNPAEKRKQLTQRNSENENTNQRIKALLQELKNDINVKSEVKPYSPSQQEILKIYEEGVFQNSPEEYKFIKIEEVEKIRSNNSPSISEISKYKLWLEQGYISPYTGKPIPLSKLFSTEYQIEHIIPQSRYFDNSLNNKIICESEINELKDNKTAFVFITEEKGRIVELSENKTAKLFTIEEYKNHCHNYFKKNRSKLKNLLSEDIPEGFINRQLNDSRYISKLIKGLLSNIVREENEEEATSKHIVPVTGAITSQLKNDWGLNDKWNEIVAPRFIRLNELTNSRDFGFWDKTINAFRTQVPDEISKGFSKKRIDHRHHALDALVIACTTKDHISYITSLNTQRKNYGLIDKLRVRKEIQIKNKYTGETIIKKVASDYHKPWPKFTIDAKEALEQTLISFKQNTRVITKANNKTWQWVHKNGILKKELIAQTKGDNRAIRKPLHKETVYGKVTIKREKGMVSIAKALENWEMIVDSKIKEIVKEKVKFYKTDIKLLKKYFKDTPITIEGKKIDKIRVFEKVKATASRVALTEKLTRKQLESITDSGIQMILENHIKNYIDSKGKEHFELAFNPDGIDVLNKNVVQLNNGKFHHPIYKVRLYEVGKKFPVGYTGNKKDKYVEAAKGTNLFFAIYQDAESKKRSYETIPLNMVIERKKQGLNVAPDRDENNNTLLFTLSPNDLVYVPNEEEQENPDLLNIKKPTKEQVERIYKIVSSTGNRLHSIPNNISKPIINKIEFSILNKLEFDLRGNSIKENCWKLKVDRLGNIKKVINYINIQTNAVI
jgi:CRISPR-associated endonuclease Csn1